MSQSNIGVLIINLGTPASATPKDVRHYLAEFLDDPRVIDLPMIVRKILLYGFILPFRPKKTAEAYEKIFDKEKGSPLLYHSQALVDALKKELAPYYRVALGMRYGNPSLVEAINQLLSEGCQKIIVLPLFPQYSSAVNGSALEAFFEHIKSLETIPSIITLSEFYQSQEFIDMQAALIRETFTQKSDLAIMFSYHSLPVRQIRKSSPKCEESCFKGADCPEITFSNQNCYRAKCFETSRRLAEKLNIDSSKYSVAFQSKLGRTQWIGPDVNTAMVQLRRRGIKHLNVVCPSFAVDCLETLEEIGMRGKEEWERLGGDSFFLVPCLNAHPEWAKIMANWIHNANCSFHF